MATIQTIYLGDLRTEATHLRSGNKLITDAPVDNQGKGEFFSPTDLVGAALGSCMLTLMDQAAARLGLDMKGTKLVITKIMASDPRRIGEIVIEVHFPRDYSDKEKLILKRAADTCPVARSLHPDLKQTVNYHFGQE